MLDKSKRFERELLNKLQSKFDAAKWNYQTIDDGSYQVRSLKATRGNESFSIPIIDSISQQVITNY